MTDSVPPKVTVLMPVYNGERYLREAIESIVNQTFTDFEFLIINDGSTDRSVEIINSCKDPRIKLVHNEINLGLIDTLNKGIDLAQGHFIARMDCDDVSLPKRLSRQVSFMDSHPEVGVCGTWVRTIGESAGDIFKYSTDPHKIQCQLLFESPLAHPSVIMRRPLLDKFQLRYEHQYLYAEDWFLWQKCSFFFSLSNIPEVLLKYRITSHSISRTNEIKQLETINNIDSLNFHKLGLEVIPEEAQIHRMLGYGKYSDDIKFIRETSSWLNKLRVANNSKLIYPEPAFSNVLAERWFTACTNATGQGLWTWSVFWQSSLSNHIKLRLIKIIKFAVKCALKWRKVRYA